MSRCTSALPTALALAGLALAGLALACTPAALPPPELPVLPVPSTPCVSVVERIAHLDQPSALGFSAVELLARVTGESVSPLVWVAPESNPEYTLSYGPETGVTNLRL